MKITITSDVSGPRGVWSPGDHLDLADKNAQPLLDSDCALPGHVPMSEVKKVLKRKAQARENETDNAADRIKAKRQRIAAANQRAAK